MAIFRFFKDGGRRHLGFWNFEFLTVGSNYVTTPNFVEIGQNAAEILRFIDFSRWLSRHLGFLKFQIFNGQGGLEGRTASSCQISSKSVQLRLKYGDIPIFQDGGRRRLGFSKFQIFNGGNGQEGRSASPCQISSKSVQPRLKYGDFSRWRPPPSWIFEISNF